MKWTFLLLLPYLVCQSLAQNVSVTCETNKYPPDPKTKVGTFVINLDLPPEKRWQELAKVKGPEIKILIDGFKEFVEDWGSAADALIAFIDSKGNVTVTCETGKYPPDPKTKVETYVINLDLPPEQRWTELAKAKAPQIKALIDGFKEFIEDWGKVGQFIADFLDAKGGNLDETLPYPFAGEIKGISDATGINLGETLLYNLFYEFSTFCTSIVTEDSTGKLYHARNLDFGSFFGWDPKVDTWVIAEHLRPLIVNLEWQRGERTIFKSVNFAGYTGILTGIKPELFTFSMNARGGSGGGYEGILKWLLGDRKESWMGFLTRGVMENATSYQEAMTRLQNEVMLVPAYFILGGNKTGQGYVITRDQEKAVDSWSMAQASRWYILETNYDHWKNPFILDNRRGPAHQCMDKMGQANASFAGLFNVLSSQPVLNKATTYTALMQVNSGSLETYIQDCKDPCAPW